MLAEGFVLSAATGYLANPELGAGHRLRAVCASGGWTLPARDRLEARAHASDNRDHMDYPLFKPESPIWIDQA
jgi:hypothetical protein